MGQKTGYEQAQAAFLVSLPALGGLLSIPSVIGYIAYLPLSVLTALLAWRLWSPPVRRPFLVLAAGALITGLLVHLLPHTDDGGVGGAGLALVMVAITALGLGVFRLRRMEAGLCAVD